MRIRFAEPGDEEEAARRQLFDQVEQCVERLCEQTSEISRGRLSTELCETFLALESRLALSLADGRDGQKRLCVSARGSRELDLLVDLLASKARAAGTALQSYAAPMGTGEALRRVHEDTGLDLQQARVRVGFGRGHLLDVLVLAPAFPGAEDEVSLNASEVLVEGILGERVLDHWVRDISCAPLSRGGPLKLIQAGPVQPETLPLVELSPAVSAAIEGLVAGLPDAPWSKQPRTTGWTMFEVEPELASDYRHQDDLAVATTIAPEMLKCFLERAPFSSLRFSRHGEMFAYLKVEATGESVARLAQRQVFEDALGDVLGPGIGCVVGNGLGIRYFYLDLALEDVTKALPILRGTCSELLNTRRAWLLFCDSAYANEWVGMLPDTPPPPA